MGDRYDDVVEQIEDLGWTTETIISDSLLIIKSTYSEYSEKIGEYEVIKSYGFQRNIAGIYTMKLHFTIYPKQLFNEEFNHLNKNYISVADMQWVDFDNNIRYYIAMVEESETITVTGISIPSKN